MIKQFQLQLFFFSLMRVGQLGCTQVWIETLRQVSFKFNQHFHATRETYFIFHLCITRSNREISPSQNPTVALLAFGEGWHNYHVSVKQFLSISIHSTTFSIHYSKQHVFPWDYKTAELGDYQLNPTTAFIDFFAKIGWAYDLKTVSHDVIAKRIERTGDGSHPSHPWGWDDASKEEQSMAKIVNKME